MTNEQYISQLEKQLEEQEENYKKLSTKHKEISKELKENKEEIKGLEKELGDYALNLAESQKKERELTRELNKSKERVKELVKEKTQLIVKYTSLETFFKNQAEKLTETNNLLEAEKEKNRTLEENYRDLENKSEEEGSPLPLSSEKKFLSQKKN